VFVSVVFAGGTTAIFQIGLLASPYRCKYDGRTWFGRPSRGQESLVGPPAARKLLTSESLAVSQRCNHREQRHQRLHGGRTLHYEGLMRGLFRRPDVPS